ncbi:hypothetical protein [Actinoplanes aureus]|nr:hypothetical protein [Actinoplanes aureus]
MPRQLREPGSFVTGLRRILDLRSRSGIATATQLDVPAASR